MICARSLVGLPGLPTTIRGIRYWLKHQAIPLQVDGNRFTFLLSDLPADVRQAYTLKAIAALDLDPGTYDDEAHARLIAAPPGMREEAERKAAVMRLVAAARQMGKGRNDAYRAAWATFGTADNSTKSLDRWAAAVRGVDPVNFAPALLADYKGGRPRADMTAEAWAYFLTDLDHAGKAYPLKKAYDDVRDLAPAEGWRWPSYPTVFRRWSELPLADQWRIRLGPKEAARLLAQPALRDKTSILPLEWVSLDGRTKDFWAVGEDGKSRRYTFLALVDCASSAVLGWELADSENARSTVRLIRRVVETFGIFDRLYTDNGSAFAGHLVAGGAVHRFRNSGKKMDGVRPLGICHHLGINLHFALPGNGQAKTAERTFATLSRAIDDRPEFRGAHAGHAPGASPDSSVVPVPLAEARRIIEREVNRHNAMEGRRGQGMHGRSYRQVFDAGYARRMKRTATERQLWLAGLIYTPVAVDRFGRVKVDGWTYGDPVSQEALLRHHGDGKRVLLGRNPDDFGQPALAYDKDDRLICTDILPVKAHAYGSVDGVRVAARNRKAARDATRNLDETEAFLDAARFKELTDRIPDPGPMAPAPAAVVEGHFKAPLKPARAAAEDAAKPVAIMSKAERNRILDDWNSERAAGRR